MKADAFAEFSIYALGQSKDNAISLVL